MTGLLAKDFRLSLDVLRPWALVLVVFSIGVLIVSRMPRSMLPEGLTLMSVPELLTVVGPMVALSSLVVSAWSTATIVQGDERHGAGLLAHAMPIAAPRRAASTLLVVVVAGLVPPIVGASMHAMGLVFLDSTVVMSKVAPTVWSGFGLAALGIACALPTALLVRGHFRASALSFLLAAVLAITGIVGAWSGYQIVVAPLRAKARAMAHGANEPAFQWELSHVLDRVMTLGGGVGCAAGAVVCAIAGVVLMARVRRARSRIAWVGVALLAALVTGGIAAKPLFSSDATLVRFGPYQQLMATFASDEEIVEAIARAGGAVRGGTPDDASWGRDWALLREGIVRVTTVARGTPREQILRKAMRDAEDFSTQENATRSLSWLVPRDDPRRLELSLEAFIRFRANDGSWSYYAQNLFDQLPTDWSKSPPPQPEQFPGDQAAWLRAYERWQDDRLREALAKAIADDHPLRERMQQALDILDAEAASR
ncbi:MAG: hypothetical protein U0572_02980 [Phycisphaerales bacterium]